MMTERDDILMQKCVDNEVTAEERRELMKRLDDVTDGWKTLACSFMEDQLFAEASCDEASPKPLLSTLPDPRAQQRHWFYHPVTSLVLSACVAFMAGMLISGEMQKIDQTSVANTDSEAGSIMADKSVNSPAAELVSGEGEYQVRIEQDGMPVRVLPVYNRKDYVSGARKYWEQIRETRGGDGYDVRDPELRFFEFTGEDGKRYVIPVERFPAIPRYQ